MPNKRTKALAANLVCVLFWGFSFISIKETVSVFPPMTLGAVRFAIALVFLWFIKLRLCPGEKLRLRDFPFLAGSGLMGVTFYFFCENNGVALVSASEASIIVAAIPVLTMTAEWAAGQFKKRPRGSAARYGRALKARHWLGALISIAGVALVAGVSLSISGNNGGYLFMAGAALCWVAYGFLTKPLFRTPAETGPEAAGSPQSGEAPGHSHFFIVFWQNLFGFLGFLPFAALEYPRWGTPNLPILLHVLFLAICCSALGYLFYAHSLEVLGMSVSSVFINLIPVITVIAGFFILGERLTLMQGLGAVLVIAGVYLTALP
jgi:drug/metabolite transporter (DMT)-like permease